LACPRDVVGKTPPLGGGHLAEPDARSGPSARRRPDQRGANRIVHGFGRAGDRERRVGAEQAAIPIEREQALRPGLWVPRFQRGIVGLQHGTGRIERPTTGAPRLIRGKGRAVRRGTSQTPPIRGEYNIAAVTNR
jgi:hypothetical protein